jgi:CBS domain containing-hemolysin-like protein
MAVGTMIIPKVYGVRHNIVIAQRTVYAWKVWVEILRPFSVFLIKIGNVLETRFQREDNQTGELNQALELATENTLTSEGDANFLRSVVNFGALTVAEVMRPREAIIAISVEIGFQQLIDYVRTTGYARLPVYRKTLDSIVGVLYTKDLLPFIDEIGKEYRWQYLIRPGFFVHETKRVSSLLKDFQEKHVHMAIAINDARNTVGLVTLEDIVQEIIGNIKDENVQS